MADQLKQALTKAGYRVMQKVKAKEKVFIQCSCGAILNRDGVCRNCDPKPKQKTILRKRRQ